MVKDQRRELRLNQQEDDLLVEAAGLLDCSVTELLLGAGLERAREVVDGHRTIDLASDARARFIAALDAPAEEVREQLADQVTRARRLKHVD